MRFSNLHQHTKFSDGKNNAEEVVLSAIEKGMESIGFSDHSYTEIDNSYCMLPEVYPLYHKEIERLKEKYASKIKIFKGIELDYYSEINKNDYDYVIASVHYLYDGKNRYGIDHELQEQLNYISDHCNGDKNKLALDYYTLLIKHVKNCKPDIVGHVDVITKFGLFDNYNENYRQIAVNAVKEIIPICKVFEMNSGAISRKKRTFPYPERYLLEEIYKLGGEIVISADSHASDTVDFYFRECVEILKSVGFKYFLKFDGEKFYKEFI
ncbi:MAG: histidinol-phosphatase HisJ family protein [Clostridia bacterium]|nr:histidinol-phosphatase HisJ family protein [Clostridia bacterium]